MSRPTIPQCDECGALKKETNHWWVMLYFSIMESHGIIELKEYNDDAMFVEHTPDLALDLCSEQCVTRAVGKWMRGELK